MFAQPSEMSSLVAIALVVLLVPAFGTAADFPASVKRCKYGDSTCLAETFTRVLQDFPGGIPELGLGATDPLYFGNITVSQSTGGPVTMLLALSESSIVGWSKATVTKVVGFDKDPRKSKFELHMKVPVDEIIGKYEMTGQLLLIKIKGAGQAKMKFTDLEMDIKFVVEVESRDGEDYLKLKSVPIFITCKMMKNSFDNLFGDKAISDNLNQVLNQNWELVFSEIRKQFGLARGKIVRNHLAPVFERFPYRMLFEDGATA